MNIKGEKTLEAILFTPFLLSLLLLCMLLCEIVYNVKEEIDGLMGIYICKLLVLINRETSKQNKVKN